MIPNLIFDIFNSDSFKVLFLSNFNAYNFFLNSSNFECLKIYI